MGRIRYYAYRFWDSSSNYDQRSYEKFLPGFTYEELKNAAHMAEENGADFRLGEGEDLDALLENIREQMFEPDVDPFLNNREAEDIVLGSAVNFYGLDVTEEEVRSFYSDLYGKHPLNSRVTRGEGGLVEEVYSVGGLYSEEISRVIYCLEKAKGYAPEDQAEAIDLLIEYYRTGDPEDFEEFNIQWVQTNPTVDFINGFIEVYHDPLGMKGSWEGLVNFVNEEKTEEIGKITHNVQYYEDSMPWDDAYKKTWDEKPIAKSVSVIAEMGDAATCCVIGINLPNEQWIREEYGSKSVTLDNIIETIDGGSSEVYGDEVAKEFIPEDEESIDPEWMRLADWMHVNFHEILGHGSGKANLEGDPSAYLREYYNTLEEARAELVALYFLPDDMTIELGLIPAREVAWAYYRSYVRSDMLQLRGFPTGNVLGEAHNQATHLIVQYLIEKGDVKVRKSDGKTYYIVNDPEEMRATIGELLADIQEIKANGQYDRGKDLVENYGKYFDAELRDEVIERYSKIEVPRYRVLVMPKLVPIRVGDEIVGVALDYNETYGEQQLRYSGFEMDGEAEETKWVEAYEIALAHAESGSDISFEWRGSKSVQYPLCLLPIGIHHVGDARNIGGVLSKGHQVPSGYRRHPKIPAPCHQLLQPDLQFLAVAIDPNRS